VLNLTTGAASTTSAMRRAVRAPKFRFTFSPASEAAAQHQARAPLAPLKLTYHR
jgi:hypothetical protein